MNADLLVAAPQEIPPWERRRYWAMAGLALSVLVTAILAVAVGAVRISIPDTGLALLRALGVDGVAAADPQATVVTAIRLPRVLLTLLVGAALAGCGAAMQGLFRNPLADPGLLGVSSGAALGAVTWIVLGETAKSGLMLAPSLGVTAAAALGSGIAAVCVQRIA
ncbi:MAG TPA: iron chelate uptake ABC transporter family permease subunit, partial [bacterium]